MLRDELKDSDIPCRTTIRKRIDELLEQHLCELEREMNVSSISDSLSSMCLIFAQKAMGKISFTMDMWTDPNLSPFMAVTAHWIEAKTEETPNGPKRILKLRAELVAFQRVPGRHNGEHLAQAFLYVLERVAIAHKVFSMLVHVAALVSLSPDWMDNVR